MESEQIPLATCLRDSECIDCRTDFSHYIYITLQYSKEIVQKTVDILSKSAGTCFRC